ncbi:lectin [Stenotrophomonas pictorum]|uniref:lectin n=2 Tax=Stenotrophomonas pictorum TaxID=86184 RepID=UPI000AF48408|nr:lectin [Stenotrophomonas pictorum]
MNRVALFSLILLALPAACERPSEPTASPSATGSVSAPAAVAGPAATTAGAGWQGYGPVPLGSDAAQLHASWPGELQGDAVADGGCYYLSPAGQDEARPFFMIEGDRFVRYDLRSTAVPAPGGGTVGMELAQLQALYPHAGPPQPHKYVDGARMLRVTAVDGGPGVLVFELGADGKVGAWRVGLPPQVDYVEGCG